MSQSNSFIDKPTLFSKDSTSPSPKKKPQQFNFQDFAEKMKHKSTNDLIKKIKDFTNSILTNDYKENTPELYHKFIKEMEEAILKHPRWDGATNIDLDSASEGLEKYIMTKLYKKTFSPTIEDIEIDSKLSSKLSKFKRIRPEHLDIVPSVVEDVKISTALEELRKINNYKTPRDKIICMSNSCKIIFNILQKSLPKNSASADVFLPILIYIVCKANVPHLHSNVKYVSEYRNPNKLHTEHGYFLTNFQSVIAFWQNLTQKDLTISEEEYKDLFGIEISTENKDFMIEIGKEPPIAPQNLNLFDIESVGSDFESVDKIDEISDDEMTFKKVYSLKDIKIDPDVDTKRSFENFRITKKFVNREFEDLRMDEVKQLLAEYKTLCSFHDYISKKDN